MREFVSRLDVAMGVVFLEYIRWPNRLCKLSSSSPGTVSGGRGWL